MAKEKKTRLDLKGLSIEAVIAELNREHGEGTLVLASKADNSVLQYVSTGSYYLDFGMGGGFPKNRITHVQGPFSSLKTTVLLKSIAGFQAKHKKGLAVIVDVERTFDRNYARALGCDLKRLIIIIPDSGEQAANTFIDILGADFDLFVGIDSLAAMIPTAVLEANLEDAFMGTQPRLINRMMQVCVARMKRSMYDTKQSSMTVVMLNQEREKIGVIYGSPITAPGGKGKEFYSSIGLRLYSSKSDAIIKEVERHGIKRKIRYGQLTKFNVMKNKCSSSQFEDGEFEYYIRPLGIYAPYEFNNLHALHYYGTFFGMIEEMSPKQIPHFLTELKEDEDRQDELYHDILTELRKSEDEDDDGRESYDEAPTVTIKKKVKIGKH